MVIVIVIEESKRDCGMLNGSVPGMLLPPFGDLSHTSILYYCDIIYMKIFEYWRRVVSKNKKGPNQYKSDHQGI